MKATSNSRDLFQIVSSFTSAHAIQHEHYGRQLQQKKKTTDLRTVNIFVSLSALTNIYAL